MWTEPRSIPHGGDEIVLSLQGVNECERNSTMFTIDREIGIERQYGVLLIDFGHPNDTRIGERHRSVPIFLK
jgi:hypothetical protein